MKHIDLFSGIGGFAIAAERVWPDIEHVFCEIDPFCQTILKKHWPNSPIYENVKSFPADAEREGHPWLIPEAGQTARRHTRPFILSGGVPCQPASVAGRRQGTEDDRWLWPETFAVIRRTLPEWVILENVRGLLALERGLVFENLCLELEGIGYEVQPIIVPACAVGAPHRRDRVWIVAHAQNSISERSGGTENERPSWETNWVEVASALCSVDDGICRKLDRAIEWVYEKNNHKVGGKKSKPTVDFFRWQALRALWEYGTTTKAPFDLHDFGLYDTLPKMPHQARPGRWLAQEKTTEKVCDLWKRFYAKPFKKAQSLQQKLLEYLGEIERTKTVALKKDDKGVWSVWKKIHLPEGKANDVFAELCNERGVDKKEIKIYSRPAWRKEALKAAGNAIVPAVAIEIMRTIKLSSDL